MNDRKPREYKILNEKDAREWMSLVMKVNRGFELDQREVAMLGAGLMIFDFEKVPKEMKGVFNNANKYYQMNSEELQ